MIFCAQPKSSWTADYTSLPKQGSILHFEDVTHDAHHRLLFRFPESLRLPRAHATSADRGRAWRHGRVSSISHSRAHENRRQPADDDRKQEQGQVCGRGLQRWTKRYKVDFAINPHSKTFDFAELDRGALVTIEDGRGAEYVTAVFAAIRGKPEDLSQRSALVDVLKRAGSDAQRLLTRASADTMIGLH
jgi:hypothetical protein